MGDVNYRLVLINYLKDVSDYWSLPCATRCSVPMFSQNVPLGWEPALAEAIYRNCEVSKSGRYKDGTLYYGWLTLINPPYRRHTEPSV